MLIDPKTVVPKAQGMSNMCRMVGMMGLAFIIVSFVIGIYVGNLNNQYWIESKAVREAAKAGEFFAKCNFCGNLSSITSRSRM